MHRHDSELQDLWKRRSELDEKEWLRLYSIVLDSLKSWRPPILRSLPEDHEIYVADFFQDKVFRPDLESQIDHVGALRVAYDRYLLGVLRALNCRPIIAESNEESEDMGSAISNPETAAASDELDGSSWTALQDATGLTVKAVAQSARDWLDESEDWIPIYLGLHHCPDAKDSDPLYKLAKKYRVANYHHKAELLGISGKRDAGYEKTLIGRWLIQDVKLELGPEYLLAVHAALKILCLAALLWAMDQEKVS